ncbi:MAG: hypothetical protein AAGI23_12780 [Bacteroidota bacterium]
MKRLLIFLSLTLLSAPLFAQLTSLEQAERRFRFAEGSLGFDLQISPAAGRGAYLNSLGEATNFTFPTSVTPRFVITGLHFWRNVDMYINIPFFNILGGQVNEKLESMYSIGPETGIKFYPWKVKDNSIRPYAGISWNLMNYRQKVGDVQGQSILRSRAPLQFGLTYNKGDKLFELGGSYNYNNQLDYAISRTASVPVEFPQLAFHLSYRWVFDSSIKDAPEYANGIIKKQVQALRERNKLSDFSFSIGLSSAILSKNAYNAENYSFVDGLKLANSHFDIGVGYYHEKSDAHSNLAFRNMMYQTSSFEFEQAYNRLSLGLELYKFLFDYHGFVPFIGVVPSYERHTFTNTDAENIVYETKQNKWTGGLIFGWDIRQDERQWYILRTNLRYYPMRIQLEDSNYRFNQFEFNFIQFVYYPSRHKWIKKARQGKL